MTEKLVTMDAPYKTFELAPDEVQALFSILYSLVSHNNVSITFSFY